MANVDAIFESEFWRACDLDNGKTYTGKIAKVKAEELQIAGTSKKKRKPVIYFEDGGKCLPVNKTNANSIKKVLGNETSAWVGATITLYQVNDARLGGDIVDAVRVRNVKKPRGQKARTQEKKTAFATNDQLTQALTAIGSADSPDVLESILQEMRKQFSWTKEQGEQIAAAKNQRLSELQTSTEQPETATEEEKEEKA